MTITRIFQRVEWEVSNRVDLIAFVVVILGFLVYIYYASGYYLNSDEASHFVFANQETLREAYTASHSTAHPPLMIMVLHLYLGLGKSVLMLRLLSALLCSIASWFTFKWLRRTYGSIEALAGLVFLTFSPAMVSVASEVRQYAMLLFFICGALYFAQRFLQDKSLWWGVAYAAFVYGAILTHYSAIWVALTFAVYVTILLFRRNPGWRVALFWGISQAGVAVLYIFLYVTHIRWMLNSGFAQDQIHGYLQGEYFNPGEETVLSFVAGNTLDFFSYLMGGRPAGIMALICFLSGIVYVLGKRTGDLPYQEKRYDVFLLGLPFLMGALGAITQVMPFGGSRHSSYLLPFSIAAMTLCAVHVLSLKRLSLVIMASLILVPLWLSGWRPPNAVQGMNDVDMRTALKQLNEKAPAHAFLFVDDRTHYILSYYLARNQSSLKSVRHKTINEFRMGKHRIVSTRKYAFSPSNFEHELVTMARSFDLVPGSSVWVMTVGWVNSEEFDAFVMNYPRGRIKEHLKWGSITLLQVTVPPAAFPQDGWSHERSIRHP